MTVLSDLWGRGPVAEVALIVAGILVASTLIVWALKAAFPAKDWKELQDRVNAWWIMAALFLGAVSVATWAALVFLGLLSFWALKEYVTLLKTRPADHKMLFLAFCAVPAQYYLVGIGWYGLFIIFVPVYVFLLLPFTLVLSADPKGFVASASQIQWGLMAFVFGLSHMAFLLKLDLGGGAADGRSLLLFLVFATEMSDVLQYIWGKLLGRHKILPTISPNKTWEGFLGGIVSVAGLGALLRFLTPFSPVESILVAGGVAVAGFCGGGVMSAVKRDYGTKDFGAVIPGHGGVLDRVDSLCYAAPLFFHYVRYMYT